MTTNLNQQCIPLIHIVEKQKEPLIIIDHQYVNEWEIDFCINFLSGLHGEEEEFIDNEFKKNNI
jgi:hypothetical protein